MNTVGWPMTALICTTLAGTANGQSHEARYVASKLSRVRYPLQDLRSIGVQALLDDLSSIADECAEDGWDGYAGRRVSPRSLMTADQFIRCLGSDMRSAELGVSPKGWVTVQWGHSPRWTFALSITDDGLLHWAALFGSARSQGTTPFTGTMPANIADLIRRACLV
jgi:hypothetical protein